MRTHVDMSRPRPDQIFVFGSNDAGIHGAGAARAAHKYYGAKWGVGKGYSGMTYAIPTKDRNIESKSLMDILQSVAYFITYVINHPGMDFFITRVGCGLAGFKDEDIAPMFRALRSQPNCDWPEEWVDYLTQGD